MPSPHAELRWLGHATALFELDGLRVLTDPVLRDRVIHLKRHASSPEHPGRLDAILLSHAHYDHLDAASLRLLEPSVPVITPRGSVAAVRAAGMRDVRAVQAGDVVPIGEGVRVRVVQAVHDGRRHPLARPSDAVGFVLEGSRRAYFAGDTDFFEGLRELGELDAALIPIWGWGSSLGPGHMDPERAAAAVAALQPALAVPIHWGTFLPVGVHGRRPELLTEPARLFAAHAARLAPGVRIEVLAPGQRVEL
jgi:L-ascorbate metabolism protein UlaG (beta-lactamase superfamily)